MSDDPMADFETSWREADADLEVWEACLDAGCCPEWILDALYGSGDAA